MSAHDTYEASIKAAEATKAATLAASEATRQLGADPKAASVAKLNSAFLAEQARQSAVMVARDLLRNSGDYSPF
jgi:hypothetical protein